MFIILKIKAGVRVCHKLPTPSLGRSLPCVAVVDVLLRHYNGFFGLCRHFTKLVEWDFRNPNFIMTTNTGQKRIKFSTATQLIGNERRPQAECDICAEMNGE